ncbi:MAG: GIY-YIG nuclease family protein [Candidatus Gorgyraea atricola]|nr:GIY-YIG nuclease family protein [Candidatus Gorgyraea atricola]
MYYVYVIKSRKDSELYIGFTNDLERRMREHDRGRVSSTKARAPFKLVYCEAYGSEKDARARELNLKLRSRAFTQLKKRIEASVST